MKEFAVAVITTIALSTALLLHGCGDGPLPTPRPTPPSPGYPVRNCESLQSTVLGVNISVLSASLATSNAYGKKIGYCLVKVLVLPAINIWVGLPSDGSYNGRFMAIGGGGFAGIVGVPESAIIAGFAGAETDTGHKGGDGRFGMLAPGLPNTQLQIDFAYRSEHLMAVVGKKLIEHFYGKPAKFSYWVGCSTGGRQGQMMAQKYPSDYQGILAGAAAIHFDKLGLGQMWPQIPMLTETGGPVAKSKQEAVTAAAIAECDALDGVVDQEIRDPRACNYDATKSLCPNGTDNPDCLSLGEAIAINKIWEGPTNVDGDLMWYGIPRGASLATLAGPEPMDIAVAQGKYWVNYDPDWDFHSLNYSNWQSFFDKTVKMMEPTIGTDYADLRSFRDAGHKLLMWHGWADATIMPEGSIDFYDQMTETMSGGNYSQTQEFARLFMAPGVGHCGMNEIPYIEALVAWVEFAKAPDNISASRKLPGGGTQTRPLCPHPHVAIYKGAGSTDEAANFECGPNPVGKDGARLNRKANERIFGRPFLPPPLDPEQNLPNNIALTV